MATPPTTMLPAKREADGAEGEPPAKLAAPELRFMTLTLKATDGELYNHVVALRKEDADRFQSDIAKKIGKCIRTVVPHFEEEAMDIDDKTLGIVSIEPAPRDSYFNYQACLLGKSWGGWSISSFRTHALRPMTAVAVFDTEALGKCIGKRYIKITMRFPEDFINLAVVNELMIGFYIKHVEQYNLPVTAEIKQLDEVNDLDPDDVGVLDYCWEPVRM